MVAKRKAPYPPRQLRRGTVDYGVTHVELDDGQLYWREHATLTPGKVVRLSGNERKVLGEAYSFAVDEHHIYLAAPGRVVRMPR